jgi:hypothetical protein
MLPSTHAGIFSFACLLETRAISLAMKKKMVLYLPEQFVKEQPLLLQEDQLCEN